MKHTTLFLVALVTFGSVGCGSSSDNANGSGGGDPAVAACKGQCEYIDTVDTSCADRPQVKKDCEEMCVVYTGKSAACATAIEGLTTCMKNSGGKWDCLPGGDLPMADTSKQCNKESEAQQSQCQ